MSCDLRRPEAPRLRVPRPRRRDPRGGDFINGPTPRDRCHDQPTRYTCVHSYAKLGAARSWVFSTARQLTPWDAYFGSNSMWQPTYVYSPIQLTRMKVRTILIYIILRSYPSSKSFRKTIAFFYTVCWCRLPSVSIRRFVKFYEYESMT